MIYALSSGSIKSGIAVIRISGTETKNVILKITKKKNFKPRSAIFTKFFVPGSDEIIDEGILIWFPNPNSYKGRILLNSIFTEAKQLLKHSCQLYHNLKILD